MRTNKRTPFKDLPASEQAGILCTNERFQRFAAEQIGFGNAQLSETATTEYLRTFCKVYSRRDLNFIKDARNRFEVLKTEFDVWTGKQPAPR